jgi:hypothetical protein
MFSTLSAILLYGREHGRNTVKQVSGYKKGEAFRGLRTNSSVAQLFFCANAAEKREVISSELLFSELSRQ